MPSPMEALESQGNLGNQLHVLGQSAKKDKNVGPLILGPSVLESSEAAKP